MRRRDFVRLLGGAAAASMAWPPSAPAQQDGRVQRVGVLHSGAADDPHIQARNTAFLQALQQLGWTDGRNIRLDIRWGAADPDRSSHRKLDGRTVAASDPVNTRRIYDRPRSSRRWIC